MSRDLAGIEGFDDDTANELQSRAREYLERSKPKSRRNARNSVWMTL